MLKVKKYHGNGKRYANSPQILMSCWCKVWSDIFDYQSMDPHQLLVVDCEDGRASDQLLITKTEEHQTGW